MLVPTTENELYVKIIAIAVIYIFIGYAVGFFLHQVKINTKFWLTKLFDGVTFGTSVMLMVGVIYPEVLKLIGSMIPFIAFASLAGILYGLHALFSDE